MADIKSPEARSRNMAAIKSRNTGPEVYFRKKLFSAGLRYQLNTDSVFGRPDLWLKKYNTAVFVHGCYWHRHKNCKYAYTPKSRIEFWNGKFDANVSRDKKVLDVLSAQGIKCVVIWECTIKRMQRDSTVCNSVIDSILNFLKSGNLFLEL